VALRSIVVIVIVVVLDLLAEEFAVGGDLDLDFLAAVLPLCLVVDDLAVVAVPPAEPRGADFLQDAAAAPEPPLVADAGLAADRLVRVAGVALRDPRP